MQLHALQGAYAKRIMKYPHYKQARTLVMTLLRCSAIERVQRDNMASFFFIQFDSGRIVYYSPYYKLIQVHVDNYCNNDRLMNRCGGLLAELRGDKHNCIFHELNSAIVHFLQENNYPNYILDEMKDYTRSI